MGLLDGKRLLITGVITDASIAYSVARVAIEQGASVVLTGFGRLSLVERVAKKLPGPAPVVELDVTSAEDLAALPDRVREHVGRDRRRAALDRVRTGVRARRRLPGDAVGRRRHRGARLDVLAAGAGEGGAAAAAGAGRLDRRAHLRRDRLLARVRLDGRREGGDGVGRPLHRPRARPARHPGQPRRRRAAADDGGPDDPRLQPVRGRLGRAGAARLGHHRPGAGRPDLRRAAVGLVARR